MPLFENVLASRLYIPELRQSLKPDGQTQNLPPAFLPDQHKLAEWVIHYRTNSIIRELPS